MRHHLKLLFAVLATVAIAACADTVTSPLPTEVAFSASEAERWPNGRPAWAKMPTKDALIIRWADDPERFEAIQKYNEELRRRGEI